MRVKHDNDEIDQVLSYENMKEHWFYYDGPVVGVSTVNGTEYCFNAYADDSKEGPLFLFSKIPSDVIQQIRDSKLDVLTTFSHPEAIIYKEVEDKDGRISIKEVLFSELSNDELPAEGVYLR